MLTLDLSLRRTHGYLMEYFVTLAKKCAQLYKHISYFKAFVFPSSHKPRDESQKEEGKNRELDLF